MNVYAITPLVVAGALLLLWLFSLKLKDASIVDIFWGPGIAGVVDIAALLGHASGPRAAAMFVADAANQCLPANSRAARA